MYKIGKRILYTGFILGMILGGVNLSYAMPPEISIDGKVEKTERKEMYLKELGLECKATIRTLKNGVTINDFVYSNGRKGRIVRKELQSLDGLVRRDLPLAISEFGMGSDGDIEERATFYVDRIVFEKQNPDGSIKTESLPMVAPEKRN